MEPRRRLEQLALLLCCVAATACLSHAQRDHGQTTPQHHHHHHAGAVRRFLTDEAENRSEGALSERTRRIDPLDGLSKYEGGYNITDKHYWSSTVFTGRSGYVIAVLWLFGGTVIVGALVVSKIFLGKRSATRTTDLDRFLDRYQIVTVVLCILLATFVVVASAVAIRGAVQFHSEAESVKEVVGRTALEATATIYNVTGAIRMMQNTSRTYNYSSSQAWDRLNSTVEVLNSEAAEVQAEAERNVRLVGRGIDTLEAVTISTVALNLGAVLLLLVGRPLRLQTLCSMCIALCWILTSLFWLSFGLYRSLDELAGDTCAALDEYRLNPRNSTLGAVVPCSERLSSSGDDAVLRDVAAGIHDVIDQVNSNIYAIKSEFDVKQLDYICNPFAGPPDYRYRPENCPSGAATIGDIPLILKRLTCSDFGGGANCAGANDLSSAIDYDKVRAYTSSIQNVLDIFPGTERLVSCDLVKAGFADIVGDKCAPLRRGARAAWAALAALSAAMALLLLVELAVGGTTPRTGDDRMSVRHLTSSSSNSEISEAEFAEMHAKKVRIRVVGP